MRYRYVAIAAFAVFGAVKLVGPDLKDIFNTIAPGVVRDTTTDPRFGR